MSMDQLQRDGITGPHELADKSGLEAACDVVRELKALQRQQNIVARLTGLPNEAPNPMIDRHMDIDVIRNLYFDDNLQAALAEHFGNVFSSGGPTFSSRATAPARTSGTMTGTSRTAMPRSTCSTRAITIRSPSP